MKLTKIFVFLLVASLLVWPLKSSAEEGFSGGRSYNFEVRDSQTLKIQAETINIKLHVGFTEVEQNFVFENDNQARKINFDLPQVLDPKGSENSVANVSMLLDDKKVDFTSARENSNNQLILRRILEMDFLPNQTRKIKVSYWQMNGAGLTGLRSFFLGLKNTDRPIQKFEINLALMDDLDIESFDKTKNPDLGLKLEPMGGKESGNHLFWQWRNFKPGVDIAANFYWPGGDLAKITDLNKNIGLYGVSATSGQDSAWQAVDSSYLTAWEGDNTPGQSLTLDLGQTRTIQQIGIMAGKAVSEEDFLLFSRPQDITLEVSPDYKETIKLNDLLGMQYFDLKKPVETNQIKLVINSVWPGKISADKVYISEIEVNQATIAVTMAGGGNQTKKPNIFVRFFNNVYQKVTGWF